MKTEDPWKKLDQIIKATSEPSGPGWFSVTEFCQRYSMSNPAALRFLRALEKEGKLEVWNGKIAKSKRIGFKCRLK